MTYHEITNTESTLDRSVLVADMDEAMLETGAWPRYNPQMVESIVVQRCPDSIGRMHGDDHVTGRLLLWPCEGWTSYKITWKDTEGHQHGRVWSYLEVTAVHESSSQTYPLCSAATEAGTVWVYRYGDQEFAELQPRKDRRAPQIGIEVIPVGLKEDPMTAARYERFTLGLRESGMTYQEFDRHDQPFKHWFGDDLQDVDHE